MLELQFSSEIYFKLLNTKFLLLDTMESSIVRKKLKDFETAPNEYGELQ